MLLLQILLLQTATLLFKSIDERKWNHPALRIVNTWYHFEQKCGLHCEETKEECECHTIGYYNSKIFRPIY